MKKIILLLLTAISVVGCNTTEKKKNDLQEEGLKGKVKSVRSIEYEAVEKFGEIQKGELSRTYNQKDMKNLYILYNKNGNQIEKKVYGGSNGKFQGKITYEYDKNGNKINANISFPDPREESPDPRGEIIRKMITYLYNKNGNLIEEIWYGRERFTYQYDENNNKIAESWYNNRGEGEYSFTYQYDENGYQITKNGYLYTDDKKSLLAKYTYQYDKNGNKITENEYNSSGRLDYKYTYEYKYDAHGNWITRIKYESGTPKTITEREIEYY